MPIENLTGRITWDDLRFPAVGINPIGGGADPTIDTADPFMGTLLFSASATNVIAGVAQMPHTWAEGTEIRPHIHWCPVTTNTGNVLWRFSYMIANPYNPADGAAPAQSTFATTVTSVSTLIASTGVVGQHLLTTFGAITMTGYKISACIPWKLERLGGDGTDSCTGTARLLEFDIHYQIDSYGSRNIATK